MSMTNVNGEKVRFSFATNPLLNRSIEWELNGTYNGLTTDLQGCEGMSSLGFVQYNVRS